MTFPQAPPLDLYHVGQMDPTRRGEKGASHEGEGLSVSPCPEAWRRIARLGDAPTWRLTAPNVRLLDIHALTEAQHAQIAQWGERAGWVTPGTAWALHEVDDEVDQTFTTWTQSFDALVAHADAQGLSPEELLADPTLAEVIPVLLPTAAYAQRMGHVQPGQASVLVPEGLAVCYAADVLGWDGAYWADRLDPLRHSAPRAVLVPGQLERFVCQAVPPATSRARPRPR